MLAAISLVVVLAHQTDASLVLFKGARLNSKEWAEAANYYIDLGEDKAVESLLGAVSAHPKGKTNTRVGLICRILFEPKGKRPLREPRFGTLSLPTGSIPLSAWPEFPLLQQDGVWFLLDENYFLSGTGESAAAYIDYCRKDGRFRSEKLAVPTKQQAVDAVKSLQGTKRWQAIRWSDGDLHSSQTYDKQWTVEILRAQTRFSDGNLP